MALPRYPQRKRENATGRDLIEIFIADCPCCHKWRWWTYEEYADHRGWSDNLTRKRLDAGTDLSLPVVHKRQTTQKLKFRTDDTFKLWASFVGVGVPTSGKITRYYS